MRTFKSVFSLIWMLVGILYCGGLLYYFVDLSGSVQDARDNGLGPTLFGLGAIGLLFCVVFVVKIVRLVSSLRSSGPRSPGSGGNGDPDSPSPDGESGIDADAVVARYLARRSAEAASASPAAPRKQNGGSASRPSFGRRVR